MFALDLAAARNLALVLVIGLLIFALASLFVMKKVVVKIVAAVLLSGLSLGVWSQRDTMQTCVKDVRAAVGNSAATGTKCTFFGSKIDLPAVTVPKSGG
jgi:hypothetical protein